MENISLAYQDIRSVWIIRDGQIRCQDKNEQEIAVYGIKEHQQLYTELKQQIIQTGVVCGFFDGKKIEYSGNPTQDFFIADSLVGTVSLNNDGAGKYQVVINDLPQPQGVVTFPEGTPGLTPFRVSVQGQYMCQFQIFAGQSKLEARGVFEDIEHRIIGSSIYHFGDAVLADLTVAQLQFGHEYFSVQGNKVMDSSNQVIAELSKHWGSKITIEAHQQIPYYLAFLILLSEAAFHEWGWKTARERDK